MTPDPLFEKLRNVEARYEELNLQLADPETVSDSKRYQKAAKAHSDLTSIVDKFREFKDLEQGVAATRGMLHEADSDPEIKQMAEDELAAARSSASSSARPI